MPPQRQTSPRTKTKTVKTARLAAASTVKAGDHVQTNAREKSRVVTGAFATDTGKAPDHVRDRLREGRPSG